MPVSVPSEAVPGGWRDLGVGLSESDEDAHDAKEELATLVEMAYGDTATPVRNIEDSGALSG